MPLTDIICKNAKPEAKSRKIADEKGLYLEVMPSGSKYCRHLLIFYHPIKSNNLSAALG